jgi:hypothetical protein
MTTATTKRVQRVQRALGAVSAAETYPLRIFQKLTGLDSWAYRQAVKKGLRFCVVGRRRYVRGSDWMDFLATRPAPATRKRAPVKMADPADNGRRTP